MKRIRTYPAWAFVSRRLASRPSRLEPSRSGRRGRILQVVLAAGAWATLMVGSSQAASPLTTPPIAFVSNDVVCIATNVSTRPATVGVDILDASTGALYASAAPTVVAPFSSASLNSGASIGSGFYICRASGLSKTTGRVTLCGTNTFGSCVASVSAP